MANIQGHWDSRCEGMAELLAMHLDSGDDIGASAAVFIDGEPVVDIWGGYVDGKWERDTIACTHSITKTMTALSALVLADRGALDLRAPVASYWPEFAANGKQKIEVRQLLGHTSGLAGWADDMSWEDVYDLEKSTALLARQAPWWEPGTASGYHGLTQGHLVGEVIRRITGKTLGRFFAEDVAGPLHADYHIGTGPEHDLRVAPFVQGIPEVGSDGNAMRDRVAMNPNLNPTTSSSVPFRRAEIGAANGHGNARSVATLHSTLVADRVNGVRLLSQAGRLRVLEQQAHGVDLVIGVPVRWGLAFALESPYFSAPQGHRIAWWGGNGGSLGWVDLDARMAVSYVMNRWIEGSYEYRRNTRVLEAAYDGLAVAM
jgi:CubicO group peptidase (beta-lactamase class C family)